MTNEMREYYITSLKNGVKLSDLPEEVREDEELMRLFLNAKQEHEYLNNPDAEPGFKSRNEFINVGRNEFIVLTDGTKATVVSDESNLIGRKPIEGDIPTDFDNSVMDCVSRLQANGVIPVDASIDIKALPSEPTVEMKQQGKTINTVNVNDYTIRTADGKEFEIRDKFGNLVNADSIIKDSIQYSNGYDDMQIGTKPVFEDHAPEFPETPPTLDEYDAELGFKPHNEFINVGRNEFIVLTDGTKATVVSAEGNLIGRKPIEGDIPTDFNNSVMDCISRLQANGVISVGASIDIKALPSNPTVEMKQQGKTINTVNVNGYIIRTADGKEFEIRDKFGNLVNADSIIKDSIQYSNGYDDMQLGTKPGFEDHTPEFPDTPTTPDEPVTAEELEKAAATIKKAFEQTQVLNDNVQENINTNGKVK